MAQGIYAFYSAGGHARETRPGMVASLNAAGERDSEVIFIDDVLHGTTVHGARIISYDDAKKIAGLKVNVAFGDPALRRKKFEQCLADGLEFFTSVHPTVIFGPNCSLGEGSILSANTMVTADAQIGRAFHCNMYSYVAHDCIVGDFVTFAPRVSLNGRIKVEDDVYIGSGATFVQGKPGRYLTIGRGAVVGAGALVTKDVEPYTTVVGNPARPLQRK